MSETYQRQQALQGTESCATVLHAIIHAKYGEEAYSWDPVTIAMEVKADFQADMSAEAMDRWCAIQTVMTSDAFFKRLDAFLGICNSLASGDPSFDVFAKTSTEEMAWAIAEVSLNRELLPFSYSVRAYIRQVLDDDGYDESNYPPIFTEVFDRHPDADVVRDALTDVDATGENKTNIDQYLDEQLADLAEQFSRIDDMHGLDDLILARGFDEAVTARGV